ncbi:hypothetical protein [Archaeoglobus sp.]
MQKSLLLIVTVTLFLGCIVNVSNTKRNASVTIQQIKSNPNEFLGKKVVVRGIYMGWKSNEPPPVTKSDWVIDDGTGRIYVTGIVPNLNPITSIGTKVIVEGYVKIKNGQPYIEATDVVVKY